MSTASDARFWDRTSRKCANDAIADQGGYERTPDRTRTLRKPDDRGLKLGCGTGSTALRLAGAGEELSGSRPPVHLQDALSRRHQSASGPGPGARPESDRQNGLRQRLQTGRPCRLVNSAGLDILATENHACEGMIAGHA